MIHSGWYLYTTMWITGFDAPSVSTIYLDKPMKNHTLMQTIARANRVFEDKHNGLIVDYVGVFRDLQKALAIYGSSSGGGVQGGECPIQQKAELVAALRQAIKQEAKAFCTERGVDVQKILTVGRDLASPASMMPSIIWLTKR